MSTPAGSIRFDCRGNRRRRLHRRQSGIVRRTLMGSSCVKSRLTGAKSISRFGLQLAGLCTPVPGLQSSCAANLILEEPTL